MSYILFLIPSLRLLWSKQNIWASEEDDTELFPDLSDDCESNIYYEDEDCDNFLPVPSE